MASDPTDLIREADEALDGITPGPWRISSNGNLVWGEYEPIAWLNDEGAVEQVEMTAEDARLIAAAPDLVRRLRDALEAAAGDACGTCLAIARDAREERDAALALLDRERAALAEANATIERLKREVNMIAAHRTDWDDNGPDHDEWLASLGEKRLDGPDMAYRGIQYAVTRLRRAIEGTAT